MHRACIVAGTAQPPLPGPCPPSRTPPDLVVV